MTAWRRPDYTKQVLASLASCQDIGNWILFPKVEPGYDEVIALFKAWRASEIHLVINKKRLGLNRNTHSALMHAKETQADIITHIEDDTVLSPDALRYYKWAAKKVLKHDHAQKIIFISGYNRPRSRPSLMQSHGCDIRTAWTPWGWAIDQLRLQWVLSRWSFSNNKCFTCSFNRKFHRSKYRSQFKEIFPRLSRIQNIGCRLGTNRPYNSNRHQVRWVADGSEQGAFHLEASPTDDSLQRPPSITLPG